MSETTPRIVVVGAGISGLSIAFEVVEAARAEGAEADLTLLEAVPTPGGKVRTDREGRFLLEWGPNGFLDNKPATLDLVRRLGVEDRLLPSDHQARRRFVFSRGRLQQLPESPPAFLKSRLLSWPGKLRLMLEPFHGRTDPEADPTVAEFVGRRLGREALARLLDPMVSGVFAGDPETLSLRAAFPRIHQLEQTHGGLFRALYRIGKERKAARKRGEQVEKAGPGPGGRLTSFQDGLQELPAAVAAALGDRVRTGAAVASLDRTEDGAWRVRLEGGEELHADVVVLATPAHRTAKVLEAAVPAVAEEVGRIPYAALAVVAFGFHERPMPLDGFGFLIPSEEGRRMLGCLWTSSIFPGRRAPEGAALLRCMVGGARAGNLVSLPDSELTDLVREELAATLGLEARPDHVTIFRHPHAIPNYARGHLDGLARIEGRLLADAPGLLLGGNAYRGISLNDCVASAKEVAARTLAVARGAGTGEGFLTFGL